MRSTVERAPSLSRTRRISRRQFMILSGSTSTLVLLAACQRAAAPPAAPVNTQEPVVARTREAIATSAPATGVAQPAAAGQATPAAAAAPAATTAPAAVQAAPTAAPAVAKPGPKGKLTEAWNTSLSPAWWDPQENPPQITPYNFQLAMHDALVKHMPGKTFAPSLAESYEIAPDFKSATFKLRPNIQFHDGSPVTTDDVVFTYEKYRGANAKILHDKVEKIDVPDSRTIRFLFKEPFVDFLMIYGSPSSGAGWIVPKAYYEKVGPNGFKQKPIGAGPYRFVRQQAGNELELEAFDAYWRKTPSIKTLVFKGIPETATRFAVLKTGEVDAAYAIQGDLFQTMKQDPNLRVMAVQGNPTWLELMALDRPDHPLKDIRVRQAISLALDRKAVNDAELGGMSSIGGNWIPPDWPLGLDKPVPPTDLAQAKKLLADAGVAGGFEISALTPLPPYFSWGERLVSQLRAVNVKTTLNTMERAAFYDQMSSGPNRLKGLVLMFSGAPGDAASRIRESAVTGGTFSGMSVPEIDAWMKQYDSSVDLQERKRLVEQVQNFILEQYMIVPVCRNVAIWGLNQRLGNKPLEEVVGAVPQYNYLGLYEDLVLKE
ncbi:MAG: ABC transporter substrate-binding protein [Chloroflexota bacterium]